MSAVSRWNGVAVEFRSPESQASDSVAFASRLARRRLDEGLATHGKSRCPAAEKVAPAAGSVPPWKPARDGGETLAAGSRDRVPIMTPWKSDTLLELWSFLSQGALLLSQDSLTAASLPTASAASNFEVSYFLLRQGPDRRLFVSENAIRGSTSSHGKLKDATKPPL